MARALLKRIKAALLKARERPLSCSKQVLKARPIFEFEFNVLNVNLIGRPRATPIIW
jgi:hypothetical protein